MPKENPNSLSNYNRYAYTTHYKVNK